MFTARKLLRVKPKLVKNVQFNLTLVRLYSAVSVDKNHYDIIISGGGMVGTTLACTLGKNTKLANKRILLLEQQKKKDWRPQEKYSNRVSALNASTQNLLSSIDAWPHIANYRFAPVKRLQVWDALSEAMITFDYDDLLETIAYIVENDTVLGAVGKEVVKTNVKVVNEAKVKSYVLPRDSDSFTKVNLENGNSYTCNLLLGCDGANSEVRKTMRSKYVSWNYNQMGVVATLKLSEPCDNLVAWQRFLPTGPIALLPLTNTLSSLVWSTTPQHAKSLLDLPQEQFVDAVNDAIWKKHQTSFPMDRAARFVDGLLNFANRPTNAVRQLPPSVSGFDEGSRAAFPLGFGHAACYVDRGVALVGDAAHRVHPLAGQGVNLGFGDVICLNEILGNAVYDGSDIHDMKYLKEYERNRQRHNVPTMLAIDGLHKLYNTSFPPLVVLRSLGLQITHALPPLKRVIIAQAAQ